MSKLVFGKNGQVRFDSEEELRTAVDYILNSSNVEFDIHEDNQNQGAWAPEERIHFKEESGVPDCLKRNMTPADQAFMVELTVVSFASWYELRHTKEKNEYKMGIYFFYIF